MTLPSHTTFLPAASVTINSPAPYAHRGRTFDLPPVDTDNTALLIQNNTGQQAYVQVGAAEALPAGPEVAGSIPIRGGDHLFIRDAAGAATHLGLCACAPGQFVVTRGRLNTTIVFA